jgi:hypothetical protein
LSEQRGIETCQRHTGRQYLTTVHDQSLLPICF